MHRLNADGHLKKLNIALIMQEEVEEAKEEFMKKLKATKEWRSHFYFTFVSWRKLMQFFFVRKICDKSGLQVLFKQAKEVKTEAKNSYLNIFAASILKL